MCPIGTWKVHKVLLEEIMGEMIIHEIIRWIIYKVKKWKISHQKIPSTKQKILPYCQKALLETGRPLVYFSVHFGLYLLSFSIVFLWCLEVNIPCAIWGEDGAALRTSKHVKSPHSTPFFLFIVKCCTLVIRSHIVLSLVRLESKSITTIVPSLVRH